MEIEFKNFRCYENKKFSLPLEGFILLKGPSGAGKSSLLKGLLYAFYGNKAIKKPQSFGKRTCSVKLKIKNMVIFRSNVPNRLTLTIDENEYEDDVAQQQINVFLSGNYEEFCISSYIEQKTNTSILSLSPAQQLTMLQSLTLDYDKNKEYQKKISEYIKTTNEMLIKTQAEKEYIEKNPVEKPETVHYPEFCDEIYKTDPQLFYKKLDEFEEKITKTRDKLDSLKKSYKSFELVKIKQEVREEKISSIKKQIKDLEKQAGQLSQELEISKDLETELDSVTKIIDCFESKKNYSEIKEEYEIAKKDHEDKHQELIAVLEKQQWPELTQDLTLSKISLLEQQRADYNSSHKKFLQYTALCEKYELSVTDDNITINKNKLKQLEKLLDVLKTELRDAELLEKQMTCPECSAELYINENNELIHEAIALDKSIEEIMQEIKETEKKIKKTKSLAEKLAKFSSVKEEECPDLEELEKLILYKTKCEEIDIKLAIELKNTESDLVRTLKEKLTVLKKKYKSYSIKTTQDNYDEAKKKLNKIISTKEVEKLKKKQYSDILEAIENLKTNLSQEVEESEKYEKDKDNFSQLKEKIEKLEKEYSLLLKERDILNVSREDIRVYSIYIEKLERWKIWNNNFRAIKIKYDHYLEKMKSIQTVKNVYKKAEIMMLESVIYNLNCSMNEYLKNFFDDNILVELSIEKNKTEALKTKTKLFYQGNEYSSIDQLSGGEFDRCILASLCGMNIALNSKLLILDESLSALDQERHNEILSYLKHISKGKLVLICSHEAVEGNFDKVITI